MSNYKNADEREARREEMELVDNLKINTMKQKRTNNGRKHDRRKLAYLIMLAMLREAGVWTVPHSKHEVDDWLAAVQAGDIVVKLIIDKKNGE